MNLRLFSTCLLFFIVLSPARSQTGNPNIDFETGTTAVWHYFTGTCCPITTPVSTPPTVNRHTLTSGSGVDPYGFFPIVSPYGGAYSLKLGNNLIGGEAEKARYFIHVPSGVSNYSLIYRYAVVFENPGHLPSEQPRFEVSAYDSVTNDSIPCAHFTYVSSATLPGFHLSTVGSGIYYRGWTNGSINLSGRGGSTIRIDFASGDCKLLGHFGYGYIDMSAGLFAISTVSCISDSVTLTGPAGFASYRWFDSSTGVPVDTIQTITIANPTTTKTLALILHPFPGYGCPDTLYSKVIPSLLTVHPANDTAICPGTSATLRANATDTAMPLTYAWSSVAGLSCSSCVATVSSPTVTSSYIVKVTNALGCIESDTVSVAILLAPGSMNDTILCPGDNTTLRPRITSPGSALSYSWFPTAGLSCITCPNPVANPVTTTAYIVAVTDSIGCTLFDTVTVARNPLSIAPANDTIICPGTSATLTASATDNLFPLTYAWSPAAGMSCATCSTTVVAPPATTTYMVTVTNPLGCTTSDTVKVSIVIFPGHSYSTTLCPGDSTLLYAFITSSALPLSYLWSPAAGLSCSTCVSPFANPVTTTTYIAIVTDSVGCSLSDTVTVHRNDLLLRPARDMAICDGLNVTLSSVVTGGAPPLTYSWFPSAGLSCSGCPAPIANPAASTEYIVSVTDSFGCDAKDTINVMVDILNLDPSKDVTLCFGETANLRSGATGNAFPVTYAWSPSDGLGCSACADPIAFPAGTTTYQVIVTDSLNCTKSASVTIRRDLLTLDPGQDTTICRGYVRLLAPTVTGTALPLVYSWSPAEGLTCTDCLTPAATPKNTTSYILTVRDGNGCTVSDSVKVIIDPCDLLFPNAFTPNGDGINDIIKVVGHLDYFTNFSLNLYNRWGERVFYTEDIYAGWDGVYNGHTADLGTYFYMILYSLYGSNYMLKGDFTLIR